MFALESDVTIGKFRFKGVNELRIIKSMHGIVDRAKISIPSIGRIISNGKIIAGNVITGKQFNDGDPVVIRIGYNGNLQTEFSGFLTKRNLNMPMELECEGYSWLLRRNTFEEFYRSVSVKALLEKAVSEIAGSYKINVQCDLDIELSNVAINNLSGFDIINNLSKYTDGSISCFFINPDTLWCGLIYTPYANGNDPLIKGNVNYRLGFNVVKNNLLEEQTTQEDPTQVKYTKKLPDGVILSGSSNVFKSDSRVHSKILNHVKDPSALEPLANEKAYKLNYEGYEGDLTSFLQPYVLAGYQANVIDDRYPERNGNYLVESVEVRFGVNGARRSVELGPKLGFAKE